MIYQKDNMTTMLNLQIFKIWKRDELNTCQKILLVFHHWSPGPLQTGLLIFCDAG